MYFCLFIKVHKSNTIHIFIMDTDMIITGGYLIVIGGLMIIYGATLIKYH